MIVVVGIFSNLIFRSKVAELLNSSSGYKLWCPKNINDLSDYLKNNTTEIGIALFDLDSTRIDPFAAISLVKGLAKDNYQAIELVAFYSHVNVELEEQANSLGVTSVYTRSQFFSEFPNYLS
jgi:hypothetical protein